MCWMCKASNTAGRLLWTNCGDNAPWRRTRRSHESYEAELKSRGLAMPVLLDQTVGLSLALVMVDTLHSVDLGVAAHIVGNTFWELVVHGVWSGRTQAESVERLYDELKAWYRGKDCTKIQGKLTVASLKAAKGWPKQKAKGLRAPDMSWSSLWAWLLGIALILPMIASAWHCCNVWSTVTASLR